MSAGKGSKPRPVKGDKFRENHDRIFSRTPCRQCRGSGYYVCGSGSYAPEHHGVAITAPCPRCQGTGDTNEL